jgi:monoterpene epsilon-lactone hydrolase
MKASGSIARRNITAIALLCTGLAFYLSTRSAPGVVAGTGPEVVAGTGSATGGFTVDAEGAAHLPAMTVPFSELASPAAKAAFLQRQQYIKAQKLGPDASIQAIRRAEASYLQPIIEHVKSMYAVKVSHTLLGGVYTDIYEPQGGISQKNKDRVLIELHGGGFRTGARVTGAVESIPVAGLGRIKVVAVDYRQGPEYKFPAASEDVASVYRVLLKAYGPHSVGIYGCSAGGLLAAEALAWFAREHLPTPGAVGIFCASAEGYASGDSRYVAYPLALKIPPAGLFGPPHPEVGNVDYFSDADTNDPLVFPIHSARILSQFPPTLIITSTRDWALSPAVHTHARLVKLGVPAELHVWEGMEHGFFNFEPDAPESREVWDVVVKFFDENLATH